MPLVTKLIRVADSTAVILDLEILREVGIEPDSEVEISVEDSAIVIRPRRYTDDDNARAAARKVIRNRRRLLDRLSK
jgi:antitoxin component of MazEF toxin-antitoxin module